MGLGHIHTHLKEELLQCMDIAFSLCSRESGVPLFFPVVQLIPSLPTSVPLIFFHYISSFFSQTFNLSSLAPFPIIL